MIGFSKYRLPVVLLIGLSALLALQSPLSAGAARFCGDVLDHEYLQNDGHIFVALDDISQPLGLSIIFDGEHYLIGGTINGTLRVDPESHTFRVGVRTVDIGVPLLVQDDIPYVPDCFLEAALGVKAVLNEETGDLKLYAEIVAITPSEDAVRITSSLPPEFQTFELTEPPRRVIDISGAFLRGGNLNAPGSILGVTCIAALRASQFTIDPPSVRIVLEWKDETPPNHTLFPESRTLAVLVNSSGLGSPPLSGQNLLEPDLSPEPVEPGPTEPEEIVVPEPAEAQEFEFEFPPAPGDADEEPEDLGPEIPSPEQEDPDAADIPIQTRDDFPEEAADYSLEQLGWIISFDLDSDGQVTVTLDTPPFRALSEFTLAGEGGMRLVMDLLGTYVPGDERRIEGLHKVDQIRIAQFQPTITRIVFDLNQVLGYQVDYDRSQGSIAVRLFEGDMSGKTIVIDPGHGGADPGAVVQRVEEADLNIVMAFELKEFLEGQGAKIILTRETDIYVTLAQRMEIAHQADADLFICIHNNSTEEPTKVQGCMILYNDPEYLPLYRLTHRGIAARTGVPGLGPVLDERGLYLLRHNGDIPVLFVEAAFMSNPMDFIRLTDSSGIYGRNIMMGVMDGIMAYYAGRDLPSVKYPEGFHSPAGLGAGIFDLAGTHPDNADSDSGGSGSAWEVPPEVAGEDANADNDENDAGDDSDSDEDDEEEEYHRRRGRGAYRFD